MEVSPLQNTELNWASGTAPMLEERVDTERKTDGLLPLRRVNPGVDQLQSRLVKRHKGMGRV